MHPWKFFARLAIHRVGRLGQTGAARTIFIIGSGRSGTNFLTACLISHPEIVDFSGGRENTQVSQVVRKVALDPRLEPTTLPRLESIYSMYARAAAPQWFLDQSHPNIWFAERWAERFPAARFIGIERNPYSVVASMLKHPGTRRLMERWDEYPVPNRYFGITDANAEAYARMSLVERCALRWRSHSKRRSELTTILGDRLIVVSYDDLCADQSGTLRRIAAQLGLEDRFAPPLVNQAAAARFIGVLDSKRAAIDRIILAGI